MAKRGNNGPNPFAAPTRTKTKEKLVEAIVCGMNGHQAAKALGMNISTTYNILRNDSWVRQELAHHEEELRKQRMVTKEKVEDIVLDAIDRAKILDQPGDMIRGASELSKMNGLYEPEKRTLTIEGEVAVKHEELKQLSDAELLKLMDEERPAIDVEFEKLEESEE